MEYRKILQWLLYLVALLTTAPLMAQTDDEDDDDDTDTTIVITESIDTVNKVKTLEIRIGTDDPIRVKTRDHYKKDHHTFFIDTFTRKRKPLKNVETDWLTLSIGLNTLIHKGSASLPPSLSNLELDPWKSVNVKVGLIKQRVNLSNHKLNLIYGLDFDNNDYRFQNNINFTKNDSLGVISYEKYNPELPGFVRNKLTTRFLMLPVSFRYESNPRNSDRSFRFELGAEAGMRLTSFFKTVREENGKRKTKERDDYYLNNMRYGAFVKVGYGPVTLYADYCFTPLFRDNTGPEFNTFSFGISFWEDYF